MKILIIRFSSIGDIVLTTPVIRCVKQQLAGAEVHFLTKKAYEGVLSANPYIDKLHLFSDSLSEVIQVLRTEKFDYVIDLHNNLRSRLVRLRLGVKASSFDKLNVQKWLLVNMKIDTLPRKHIVDRYLEAAAPLGIRDDGKGLDYFLREEHDLEKLLPASHHDFTGIVTGAQHGTKQFPVHKTAELCRQLGTPVVLLGGPEDAERCAQIAAASGPRVFNGAGKFSLDESAYLVKMARQIITNDTGLMHIAAAFKKPVISLWGNTVPEFGMYPYKTAYSAIVEVKDLKCRPCSKIGYAECPLGHFKCMNDIDVGEVARLTRLNFKTAH